MKVHLFFYSPVACVNVFQAMYFIGVGRRNDRTINDIHRDARVMRPMPFPRVRLSTSVDLRRWMTPIENQEDMNTW